MGNFLQNYWLFFISLFDFLGANLAFIILSLLIIKLLYIAFSKLIFWLVMLYISMKVTKTADIKFEDFQYFCNNGEEV
jgi:hypothetical protein